MSWKRRSAGSPPTLWWVLIFCGGLGLGCRRFDDVRVERALGQEVDPTEFGRLLLEDPDELVADDLALLLGVLDAGQSIEESPARLDHDQAHPEVSLEGDPEELGLLLAHQAVVDVDAGQPVADRTVDEGGRDRRIDAAREGADDEPVRAGLGRVTVDPFADAGHRRVDEVGRRPGPLDAGDADDEVAQDVAAAGRVDDLGMELDPVQVALRGGEPGERRGIGLRGGPEPVGEAGDGVAVAHPDRLLPLDAGEQAVVLGDRHGRGAVLAVVGREHIATELERHHLRPVADAQDRDRAAPDGGVRARRVRVVHGHRAAGQDDGLRPAPHQFLEGRVVGEEFRVHVQLADASRDQLGELAAEIEDGHRAGCRRDGADGPVVGGPVGGRGVQRGLEVRLHLGVVRGQDAVARVRFLAVDRLAARLGLVGRPPGCRT